MKKQFVISTGECGTFHAAETADRYPGFKIKRFFVNDRQEEYAAAYVPSFVPPVSTAARICEGARHLFRSRSLTHCLQLEFLDEIEIEYKSDFATAIHNRIQDDSTDLHKASTFLTRDITPHIQAGKIDEWEVRALKAELANLHPHRDIMTPAPELGEGIFAITRHLGEGRQPQIFTINGEAHMDGGRGLTQLELMIYNEAQTTAQGDPVLPHLDRSKRAWFKYAGGIRKHFGCTVDEAEALAKHFDIIEVTAKTVKPLEAMLSTDFASGLSYIEMLSTELRSVTDVDSPVLDLMESSEDQDDDEPMPATPEVYHKLDDSRDVEPYWEDRQPKVFRDLLAKIRTADLPSLKIIGQSLFNDKSFNRTQLTVIWDEYHRRKTNISPRLTKIAVKALSRLADPTCDLKAVAKWLYGDGQKKLTKHDQSVLWAAWKKLKPETKTSSPVQEEIPFGEYNELIPTETDYPYYE